MTSGSAIAGSKKKRPPKQDRLKKRKIADTEAAGAESEDEDEKAAREHRAQQKPKTTEELDGQEKPGKKRKRDDGVAKNAGEEKSAGEKKPRLPKHKRVKAKARGEAGAEEGADEEDKTEEVQVEKKKEARFIVFIGNLPFTATKAALVKHFAAVKPASVRVITKKEDPTKCKGFAFLEFEGYDRMQSCLLKFHHTMFNDGSGERKINVELTAGGGGGKSEARKAKLVAKNGKLDEQRKRKIEEEEKLKTEKKAKQPQAASGEMGSGIHPSRRRQVKK